jgi:hypothetical protein
MLTPELGESLLKMIVTELISVRAAMQRVGLVSSQIHRWKKTDMQFRSQYEHALLSTPRGIGLGVDRLGALNN